MCEGLHRWSWSTVCTLKGGIILTSTGGWDGTCCLLPPACDARRRHFQLCTIVYYYTPHSAIITLSVFFLHPSCLVFWRVTSHGAVAGCWLRETGKTNTWMLSWDRRGRVLFHQIFQGVDLYRTIIIWGFSKGKRIGRRVLCMYIGWVIDTVG